MARRQSSTPVESFLETIIDIAKVLPYWASISISLLLFIFVPFETSKPVVDSPNDLTTAIVFLFLSATFKYMVPFALLAGAVIKFLLQIKSSSLFNDISKRGAREVISRLSWQDFEFLLSEYFKKQGYRTEITGGGGADGGIDIKMYKNGELHLVQCKHYKSWRVSVQVVREFFGVMAAEKASGGYIITSGKFTKSAHAFAKGKNIQLLNGRDLVNLLDTNDLNTAKEMSHKANICPKCGGQLLERNGKFGKFLGCDNYPRCKFTQNLT